MMYRISKSNQLMMGRVKSLIGVFVVLMVGLLDASTVRAQSEDEIKAAFLLNFARYVEWPASTFSSEAAPVRICMFEAGGFGNVVSTIVKGKTVGPRSVEVQNVATVSTSDGCHILFVGSGTASAPEILNSLGRSNVFTVADDEKFARSGGVANFFRANDRVRFEINPSAAESAGLKISSRLLRLAQLVE